MVCATDYHSGRFSRLNRRGFTDISSAPEIEATYGKNFESRLLVCNGYPKISDEPRSVETVKFFEFTGSPRANLDRTAPYGLKTRAPVASKPDTLLPHTAQRLAFGTCPTQSTICRRGRRPRDNHPARG